MNALRCMPNRNQRYYMRLICSGDWVIQWDPEHNCYVHTNKSHYTHGLRQEYVTRIPKSKSYRRKWYNRTSGGDGYTELIFEWIQRGFLVDVNGRLMPSKDVARAFGNPPPLPMPKRVVKMSRTRPARVQGDEPVLV